MEIVWETHEITKISFNQRRRATAFCQSCESDAPHLSVAEAAALLQTTAREIFRRVEMGEIHFLEIETGALPVCRNRSRLLKCRTKIKKEILLCHQEKQSS